MAKFVSFLNPSLVDQEGLQKYLTRLFGPGVATAFNANGWKVTQRGAGANMSVDIAVGDGLLLRPSGDYGFWGWTTATENVAVTAANPTNPRVDVVVAWIDTSVTTTGSANSPNALKFQVMAGTPAGSPTAMADATIQSTLGAAVAWIKLATLLVPAGSSSVVNANISDVRIGISSLVSAASVLDGAITTTKIADSSVTNAKLNIPWQPWAPTLANLTIGNGSVVSRYVQEGKTVRAYLEVTWGSTTSLAGTFSYSIPVTASSNLSSGRHIVGNVTLWDSSGTAQYLAVALLTSTTVVTPKPSKADGTYGYSANADVVTGSSPAVWAVGDVFTSHITYEAS